MLITFEKIFKSIGRAAIVEDLSVNIKEDQSTIIIGPSGCGNSTLLRLILGLVKPNQGTIYLNNEVLPEKEINFWRRQIGYMTQDGGLFPHLTARSNVTLMAQFLQCDPEWIEDRIRTLGELVRLPSQLLLQYPSELSGGQRQRVSLMRALLLDPKCLLLDEPLGALDPITRYELQVELKEIFEKLHKTILMVTHDMREAAYFGKEIILMRAGRIVQIGSFTELLEHPVEPFVTEFIKLQQFPIVEEMQICQ
jgi:osmoprotectant transport system ATP-binding protein